MKKLSLQELQKVEFDILCVTADICEKNNLNYSLAGGTLLGAVRHGEFIPWDDDIDIVMPRGDYEKFIGIFSKESPKRYKILTPHADKNYIYEYIKVVDMETTMIEFPETKKIHTHVYIDIFPVDGMPDTRKKQEQHLKSVHFWQLLRAYIKRGQYRIEDKKRIVRCISKILCLINTSYVSEFLITKLDKISKKYSYENSHYAAVVTGSGMKEVLKKEDYLLDGKIEFCGREFSTYNNPEIYLSSLYGDYMKLPPIGERKGHDCIAWIQK